MTSTAMVVALVVALVIAVVAPWVVLLLLGMRAARVAEGVWRTPDPAPTVYLPPAPGASGRRRRSGDTQPMAVGDE